MIDETPHTAIAGDDETHSEGVSYKFAAPLGATPHGRLIFASGATNVTIGACENPAELYAAYFEEHLPSVRVQNGVITIQYRRYPLTNWLADLRQPLARIALNSTIEWEIEFRDGVSGLNADLRALQLAAVDMGSVSTAILTLPAPTVSANIYLSGSASDLTLQRPSSVGIRLHIAGAASHLRLDGQYLGATGGDIRWQSANYNDTPNRYDVGIAGSVSHLTVATFVDDVFSDDTFS